VLLDDAEQTTEGALVMAAQYVTSSAINIMSKFARGLICLALSKERSKQLGLSPIVVCHHASVSTNYTVSIDATEGITTGISTMDRAHTIQTAVHVNARPGDVVSPGHVFPLVAESGGVLVRAGHTEAGCDIARLAELDASAVICEILQDNGDMARLPELLTLAVDLGLKVGTIQDLVHYRSQHERLVKRVGERLIDTSYGIFRLIAYQEVATNEMHLALVKGDIVNSRSILVHIQESLTMLDLLNTQEQYYDSSMQRAIKKISEADRGVVVMLRTKEKSEDIINAINTADCSSNKQYSFKDYGVSAQILRDLGVLNMRLMGKSRKVPDMTDFGLNLTGFVAMDE